MTGPAADEKIVVDLFQADPELARPLLESLDQIHLVAIGPNGEIKGGDFGVNVDKALERAAAMNRHGSNIYFTVNAVPPKHKGKPGKADIVAARFAHVDIDPPKDGGPWNKAATLETLARLEKPPSFVIDSGNGLQAFWRLAEPCENWKIVEAANRGIRDKLGGDDCWNIDRLLRLPGFVNWPNDRKKALGRVPCLASIATEDDGAEYTVDELVAAFPEVERPVDRVAVEAPHGVVLMTPDDLELGEHDPLRSAIEHPPGNDRSADLLAAARLMVKAGYDNATVMAVLLNPANPVSAHALAQRDPRRAVLRVLELVHKDAKPGASTRTGPPLWEQAITARELYEREFDPIRFIVDGLIAEGVTILAGRPKAGKSWMALDFALAVAGGELALGELPVLRGDVLFLGLEDNRQRLQSRLIAKRIDDLPDRLLLATEWPRLDQGCIEELEAWAEAVPEPRLVVVDVLKMVKQESRAGENIYDADYRALMGLAAFARKYHLAVLVVHHTRKSEAADPLEGVSGSNGLTGAADAVLVLQPDLTGLTGQQPDTPSGRLFARGRDIEASGHHVRFDQSVRGWLLSGWAHGGGDSPERRQVRDILTEAGKPLKLEEIARIAGKDSDAVRKVLSRLMADGDVTKTGRGVYVGVRSLRSGNMPVGGGLL